MNDLKQRFDNITQQIQDAAQQFQRPAPLLLAVSKKHSADAIRALCELGQEAFGESYAQEAIEKQQSLKDLAIEWHFIGPIQSNKTKDIANHFAWVHSIDRLKIAKRLNDQRDKNLAPLDICIQVNIDEEDSKSGVFPNDLETLCNAIKDLPNLRIRGLMCLPKKQASADLQRAAFKRLANLQQHLKQNGFPDLDTLSMGMSNDFEAAIAEGATIVRVGTALFGERQQG